jgi:hypothetical protein
MRLDSKLSEGAWADDIDSFERIPPLSTHFLSSSLVAAAFIHLLLLSKVWKQNETIRRDHDLCPVCKTRTRVPTKLQVVLKLAHIYTTLYKYHNPLLSRHEYQAYSRLVFWALCTLCFV